MGPISSWTADVQRCDWGVRPEQSELAHAVTMFRALVLIVPSMELLRVRQNGGMQTRRLNRLPVAFLPRHIPRRSRPRER